MGFESFGNSQPQNTNEKLDDNNDPLGYGRLAEQSKKEKEAEEKLPRLTREEEIKIRSRIEELEGLENTQIFKENQFRENNQSDPILEERVSQLFVKPRLDYQAERSKLERELRRAEVEK